jgi:hypothetical protein
MTNATKIQAGIYSYKGFTIDKDLDFPEYDWRIYDSSREWVATCLTKRDAMLTIDSMA